MSNPAPDTTPATSRRGLRLARIGQGLSLTGMLAGIAVVAWSVSDAGRFVDVLKNLDAPIPAPLPGAAWLAGSLVLLVSLSMFVWTMLEAAGLFGAFAKGDLLSPSVEKRLAGLSRACLAGAVCTLLQPTALALAVTAWNPPGQRMLVLSVSSHGLTPLLAALLLALFAGIIRDARRTRAENEAFV